MSPLLQVRIDAGYPGKPQALRNFEIEVNSGQVVGLVGESGSGKSTVALAILRLLEYRGGALDGEILFRGHNLLALKQHEIRKIRGRDIALVLQSAGSSLNPALTIGTQLSEAWKAHRPNDRGLWKQQVLETFERVRLPATEAFLSRYPRQISLGQAQRVLIAMAVLHRPALLVADEPTSALDTITQAEVLGLLRQLNLDLNMAVLFISHDLASVASVCDHVAVMQAGAIVERGSVDQIFRRPTHSYTRALLQALPRTPDLQEEGDRHRPDPRSLEALYSVSSTKRSTDME